MAGVKGVKWSTARRAKFQRTMAARRNPHKVLSDWAKEIQNAELKDALKMPNPSPIYVLINGKLKEYTLRNMPVYVPTEELKP